MSLSDSLEALFRFFDATGTGKLTRAKALALARALGVKDKGTWWASLADAANVDMDHGEIPMAHYVAWEESKPSQQRLTPSRVALAKSEAMDKANQHVAMAQRVSTSTAAWLRTLENRPIVLRRDDGLGIAGHAWNGSVALLAHCERTPESLRGRRIVELGAGTGLLGIGLDVLLSTHLETAHAHGEEAGAEARSEEHRALSRAAHSIAITDLPQTTYLIEANIRLNHAPTATAVALRWGDPVSSFQPPLDVVLMADVAYVPATYPALAATVAALCGPRTLVLHGYVDRSKCQGGKLFDELSRLGFTHEDLPPAPAAELSHVRIVQHHPPPVDVANRNS